MQDQESMDTNQVRWANYISSGCKFPKVYRTCPKNYAHWLAVDKAIAKISRLTFLAHPVLWATQSLVKFILKICIPDLDVKNRYSKTSVFPLQVVKRIFFVLVRKPQTWSLSWQRQFSCRAFRVFFLYNENSQHRQTLIIRLYQFIVHNIHVLWISFPMMFCILACNGFNPRFLDCRMRRKSWMCQYFPRDATHSKVIVCPSVRLSPCDNEVRWSHRLEYFGNNFTADYPWPLKFGTTTPTQWLDNVL